MLNSVESLSILRPYQIKVEKVISMAHTYFGPQSKLKEACMYSLSSGGKRFRPILVLMLAKALEKQKDPTDAALAVEFFHTSSLIADDLPCMDNDDFRRNKPTTHKLFGESTALLASYALIAAGYEAIAKATTKFKKNSELCCLAIKCAADCTGVLGATGGQWIDLSPPDFSFKTIQQVIQKKTISLFELSFVLGWLFGGGDVAQIDLVKKAAYHFGYAFQVADDIDDVDQDANHEYNVNIATLFGVSKAREIVRNELDAFYLTMEHLGVDYKEFKVLGEQLNCPPISGAYTSKSSSS